MTDPLFIAGLDISPEYLEESKAAVLREIERRRQVYLGNRPPLEVAGRTVIIVDDGIATGATHACCLACDAPPPAGADRARRSGGFKGHAEAIA